MKRLTHESSSQQSAPVQNQSRGSTRSLDSTAQLQRAVGNQAVGAFLRGYGPVDVKIKHEHALIGLEGIKGKFSIEIDLLQPFFTQQKKDSGNARSVIEAKFSKSGSDFNKVSSELSLTALEYDVGSWDLGGVTVEIKLGAGKIDVSDKVELGLVSIGIEAQSVINAAGGYAPIASLFFEDARIADMVANGLQIKYGLSAEVGVDAEDLTKWRRQRELNEKLSEAEKRTKQLTDEGQRLSDEISTAEKRAKELERTAKKNGKLLERKRARLEKVIEKQKKMPGRRLDDLKEAIEKIQQKQDAIQKELSTIEDLVDQNKKRIGGILDEVHDVAIEANRHTREIERLASTMKGRLAKLVGKRLFKTALRFVSHILGPIALLLDLMDVLKIALYFDRLSLSEGIPLDELPFFPPEKGPEGKTEVPATEPGLTDGAETPSGSSAAISETSEARGQAKDGSATTDSDSSTGSDTGHEGDRAVSPVKLEELAEHPVAEYVYEMISAATGGPALGDSDIDELIRIVEDAGLTMTQSEGLQRFVKGSPQATPKAILDNLRQYVQKASKEIADETTRNDNQNGAEGKPQAVEVTPGIGEKTQKKSDPVHELEQVNVTIDPSKVKVFNSVRYLYIHQFNPTKSLNVPLTATITGRIQELNSYTYRLSGATIIVTKYDPDSQKVIFEVPEKATWSEPGGYQLIYEAGKRYAATYKSTR